MSNKVRKIEVVDATRTTSSTNEPVNVEPVFAKRPVTTTTQEPVPEKTSTTSTQEPEQQTPADDRPETTTTTTSEANNNNTPSNNNTTSDRELGAIIHRFTANDSVFGNIVYKLDKETYQPTVTFEPDKDFDLKMGTSEGLTNDILNSIVRFYNRYPMVLSKPDEMSRITGELANYLYRYLDGYFKSHWHSPLNSTDTQNIQLLEYRVIPMMANFVMNDKDKRHLDDVKSSLNLFLDYNNDAYKNLKTAEVQRINERNLEVSKEIMDRVGDKPIRVSKEDIREETYKKKMINETNENKELIRKSKEVLANITNNTDRTHLSTYE